MSEQNSSHICLVCGHVYEPAVGDPERGVPPGTPWQSVPDAWICPDCLVGKDEFEPLEF